MPEIVNLLCPLCGSELEYTNEKLADEDDRMGHCADCCIMVPAYMDLNNLPEDDTIALRLILDELLGILDRELDGGYGLIPSEWAVYIAARKIIDRLERSDVSEQVLIPRGVESMSLAVGIRGAIVSIQYERNHRFGPNNSTAEDIKSPRVTINLCGGNETLGQIEHTAKIMREALFYARNFILRPGFPGLVNEEK